ncbi:T9SS type B sorting domain-containing protein [uncultured Psychroserpens sp.]|uniref:T9SS type B sorting domain-containing protein n=1 Tax=uncultured Psychroserpens sp. TaxID=255436 RepID=UPI00260DC9D2|nr:T9SS type B sorting domain-containing protein [uncultured Psychroserpens sp.]
MSIHKLTVFVFFLVSTCLLSAQNEAAIWYFGSNAGLDFNSGVPVALFDGELNTSEGCASIADSNGQLLFYTDGITVWDRNHDVMPNGTGLAGDPSSTQSGIIVPKPSDTNIYYVFAVDREAGSDGLTYSEVDMTLNGGNGAVNSVKNVQLIPLASEKISAIEHSNGLDYWVVAHEWGSNNFVAFEVTDAGINTTPVISSVGSDHSGDATTSIGYMKISPDGTKIALAKYSGDSIAEVFDFDTSTGIVSNTITIDGVFFGPNGLDGTYGIEFSPDSSILYVSDVVFSSALRSRVHQFDLTSNDQTTIINSDTILYDGPNVIGAMQLAIDEKIYLSNLGNTFLDVIEDPNVLGTGANYVEAGVDLGGRSCNFGLPPFIQSFFNVGIQIADTCFGDETQFLVNSNEEILSITWDFGDGTSSTEENPTHIYASTGTYDVNVEVVTAIETRTLSKTIEVYEVPIANSVANFTLCDDASNDETESFDLSTKISEVLNGQSDTTFDIAFYSSMEDAEANMDALPIDYNNVTNPEEVFVKVFNAQNNACSAITSFELIVSKQAVANPVPDLILCDDEVNDGLELVDLTLLNATVLANQPESEFTITYHLNQDDANDDEAPLDIPYQTISNPQTIYVRIENSINTDCFDTTPINIIVDGQLIAFRPDNMNVCDDVSEDGIETFLLTDQNAQIVNGQAVPFEITYHVSEEDAIGDTNPLPNSYQNASNPQTVYARIENEDNAFCYDITSFELNVLSLPDIVTQETYYLCTGDTMELEAEEGFDYYNWSTGQTTRAIDINQAGTYTVEIIDDYQTDPAISCSRLKTYTIIESGVAVITNIEIDDWSQNDNTITVFVEGLGDYEYSLDGVIYQDSNVFLGLSPDTYTVYVRDKNDCGVVTEEVFLLYYPKFFTPNGDTYNPTWQIINASSERDLEVLVFDRYGKLIAEFSGSSIGWDGTYSGQNMPASDYWFVVKRPSNGRTYKGHFALKR